MLLERNRAQLLIIDVQTRLAPHVAGGEGVIANCVRLAGYARLLGVPVTVSEHYSKGLGPTAPSVLEALPDGAARREKIAFSCWRDADIKTRIEELRAQGRDQIVVAGMEAHVCVGQTVLDLLDAGRATFLVGDAVGSREPTARELAIARMRGAGAIVVAQEMVAFEWLGRGDDPAFKDVVAIVK